MRTANFPEQFRKLLTVIKRICYSLDIMRQTARLVINPIIVDGYVHSLCISVLRVASGPRVKLAGRKSALTTPARPSPFPPPHPTTTTVVYSTDHSKALVPVLVLLFVALWFILRGDLFYVLPCVILLLRFFFFSSFSIAITLLVGERELVLVFFVRLFDLRFVCILFHLVSGKGCGL